MQINVTDSTAHQAAGIEERERFLMCRRRGGWEFFEQRDYFVAMTEVAAGQLANDEVVTQRRQPMRACRCNQSLEVRMNQGRLLVDVGQPARLSEKSVVDIQGSFSYVLMWLFWPYQAIGSPQYYGGFAD